MKVHAICMVPSPSELAALPMSEDRIAESLLNHELSLPSAAAPDPCYLHSVPSQDDATTHAICVVSSLLEQTALVVEKNRVRHSRLMNYSNGCK